MLGRESGQIGQTLFQQKVDRPLGTFSVAPKGGDQGGADLLVYGLLGGQIGERPASKKPHHRGGHQGGPQVD